MEAGKRRDEKRERRCKSKGHLRGHKICPIMREGDRESLVPQERHHSKGYMIVLG